MSDAVLDIADKLRELIAKGETLEAEPWEALFLDLHKDALAEIVSLREKLDENRAAHNDLYGRHSNALHKLP